MKILLLCKQASSGGGLQKVFRELADSLQSMGETTLFAALSHSRQEGPRQPGQTLHEESHAVPDVIFGTSPIRGAVAFGSFVRRWKPDIILSGHEQANFANVAARLLFCSRHRIVLSRHVAFTTGDVREGGQLRAKMLQPIYRRADAVVGVSAGVSAELRELVGAGSRVETIYNPVVTPSFWTRLREPPSMSLPNDGLPIFVAAGRLVPQKDFATLLRAFAIVQRRLPSHLVIVGEGPEHAHLDRLREDLGVAGRVRLVGYVPNPLPVFAKCDCFVSSSRWEGFGLAIAEALLAGLAVAATDCPFGPREILQDGNLGQLAETGNPTSLAEAMVTALTNGPPDVEGVADRFSSRTSAERYLRLFKCLLSERRGA